MWIGIPGLPLFFFSSASTVTPTRDPVRHTSSLCACSVAHASAWSAPLLVDALLQAGDDWGSRLLTSHPAVTKMLATRRRKRFPAAGPARRMRSYLAGRLLGRTHRRPLAGGGRAAVHATKDAPPVTHQVHVEAVHGGHAAAARPVLLR